MGNAHTTRRGRRPLVELYLRWQHGHSRSARRSYPLDDDALRAYGRFILEVAAHKAETALYRSGDGLFFLALLAAGCRLQALVETLTGYAIHETAEPAVRTGLLTSEEVNLVNAYWRYVAELRAHPPHPSRPYIGPMGRVREDTFLIDNGHDPRAVRTLQKNAYRFLDDLCCCPDRPAIFRKLPSFAPLLAAPWDGASTPFSVEVIPGATPGRPAAVADQPSGLLSTLVYGAGATALIVAVALLVCNGTDREATRRGEQQTRVTADHPVTTTTASRWPRVLQALDDLASRRDPEPPEAARRRDTAARVLPLTLDHGLRHVLGWSDGHWQIHRPDGAVEFVAPAHLRVSGPIDGGAAGDLSGDGVPELALYVSAAYEVTPGSSGVWLFGKTLAGWQLFDWLPPHRGVPDQAFCAEVRQRHQAIVAQHPPGGSAPDIPIDVHQAREFCPSELSGVEIRDQAVHLFLRHYGRQYLISRCDSTGCEAPWPVLSPGCDITGSAHVQATVESPAGAESATERSREFLILSTGPWREDSEYAYGALVLPAHEPSHDDGADSLRQARFMPLGGYSVVAAIDPYTVAIHSSEPAFDDVPVASPSRLDTLLLARVSRDGQLRSYDEVRVPGGAYARASLVSLRDARGEARHLALLYSVHDGGDGIRTLRVYDLDRPLAGQRPLVSVPAQQSDPRLGRLDVTGDRADELVISDPIRGTTVYSLTGRGLVEVAW